MGKKIVSGKPGELHIYGEGKEGATLTIPEYSKWVCYLFGNTPHHNDGIAWRPHKGNVPNIFIRFMMGICFGCTWVKEKDETEFISSGCYNG